MSITKTKKDCTTSVLLHAAQIWTMKTQTEDQKPLKCG